MLIHPLAGVLSAYGMGLADVTAMRETAGRGAADRGTAAGTGPGGRTRWRPTRAVRAGRPRASSRARPSTPQRRAHLRYEGTDTALPVPLGPLPEMVAAFEQVYRQYFSFLMPDKAIIAEAVSVEARRPVGAAGRTGPGGRARRRAAGGSRSGPGRRVAAKHPFRCTGGGWTGRRWPGGGTCGPASGSTGPALIVEDFATTVVEPGWRAEVTRARGPAADAGDGAAASGAAAGPRWTR